MSKHSGCDCPFCRWCDAQRKSKKQNFAVFVLAIAITGAAFYFLKSWE